MIYGAFMWQLHIADNFTFRARQQSMRESRTDTAAIEVDRAPLLAAWKNHAPAKSIPTLVADQPRPPQHIKGIAPVHQMTPQIAAQSVAHAQFLQQGRIPEASLVQILHRFGMAVERPLVKGRGLVQ
jgi:hypothetical protein